MPRPIPAPITYRELEALCSRARAGEPAALQEVQDRAEYRKLAEDGWLELWDHEYVDVPLTAQHQFTGTLELDPDVYWPAQCPRVTTCEEVLVDLFQERAYRDAEKMAVSLLIGEQDGKE